MFDVDYVNRLRGDDGAPWAARPSGDGCEAWRSRVCGLLCSGLALLRSVTGRKREFRLDAGNQNEVPIAMQ